MNEENRLVGVYEVMDVLGVSKATAYKIIRELNEELKAAGVRTIAGRVNLRYFDTMSRIASALDVEIRELF